MEISPNSVMKKLWGQKSEKIKKVSELISKMRKRFDVCFFYSNIYRWNLLEKISSHSESVLQNIFPTSVLFFVCEFGRRMYNFLKIIFISTFSLLSCFLLLPLAPKNCFFHPKDRFLMVFQRIWDVFQNSDLQNFSSVCIYFLKIIHTYVKKRTLESSN